MDIYTAEIQIERLLKYVTDLAASHPTLYAKSKVRWQGVADKCEQISDKISELAGPGLTGKDLSDQYMSDIQQSSNSFSLSKDARPTLNTNKIPKDHRKSVMSKYITVLSEMYATSTGYIEVDQCIELLYNWMSTRFFSSIRQGVEFRYNIRRICYWLYDIVIVFGKHLDNGTLSEFLSEFEEWCEGICQSSNTTQFAVPYEVYKVNRNIESEDITLSAAVIWDVLLDHGLSQLCQKDTYGLFPEENGIYNICVQHSPDVLDKYVNYKLDESVMHLCKISKYD